MCYITYFFFFKINNLVFSYSYILCYLVIYATYDDSSCGFLLFFLYYSGCYHMVMMHFKVKKQILLVKVGILILYYLMKYLAISCKIYRHYVNLKTLSVFLQCKPQLPVFYCNFNRLFLQ